MGMLAYPFDMYPSKRLLKEAIQLAGVDVAFVVGQRFFGTPVLRRLSELAPGEILPFCGPRPDSPKYYGRLAKSAIRGVESFEVE